MKRDICSNLAIRFFWKVINRSLKWLFSSSCADSQDGSKMPPNSPSIPSLTPIVAQVRLYIAGFRPLLRFPIP